MALGVMLNPASGDQGVQLWIDLMQRMEIWLFQKQLPVLLSHPLSPTNPSASVGLSQGEPAKNPREAQFNPVVKTHLCHGPYVSPLRAHCIWNEAQVHSPTASCPHHSVDSGHTGPLRISPAHEDVALQTDLYSCFALCMEHSCSLKVPL